MALLVTVSRHVAFDLALRSLGLLRRRTVPPILRSLPKLIDAHDQFNERMAEEQYELEK